MTKILYFSLKIRGVVGRVAHAKSSDPATPSKFGTCTSTYFMLKRDRFLTTAIFTGSTSTVHNSLKIMFKNFTFWCDPGYDTCLSVLRIPFLE